VETKQAFLFPRSGVSRLRGSRRRFSFLKGFACKRIGGPRTVGEPPMLHKSKNAV